LYVVENPDHEDKVAAHKKVKNEVKIGKDESLQLDDCSIDLGTY